MANKKKRPNPEGRTHTNNKKTRHNSRPVENKAPEAHPRKKKKLTPRQRRKRRLKKRMRLLVLILVIFLIVFMGFKAISALTDKDNEETSGSGSNHEISTIISNEETDKDVISDNTISDIVNSSNNELNPSDANSSSNSNAELQEQEEPEKENLPEDNSDSIAVEPSVEDGDKTEIESESEAVEPEPEVKRIIGTVPEPNEFCTLVNADNPLDEDFKVRTGIVLGTQKPFDSRAVNDFEDMLSAASDAGYPLYVVSTYRSISYQDGLFQKKVNEYLTQGYNRPKAEEEAAKWVAPPGTSEHNLGLVADIVSAGWYADHNDLEQSFENMEHFKWLYENCSDYGFILRYPKGKEDITGIAYEPWHYRYVGKEVATFIMNNELTLEEYLDMV